MRGTGMYTNTYRKALLVAGALICLVSDGMAVVVGQFCDVTLEFSKMPSLLMVSQISGNIECGPQGFPGVITIVTDGQRLIRRVFVVQAPIPSSSEQCQILKMLNLKPNVLGGVDPLK